MDANDICVSQSVIAAARAELEGQTGLTDSEDEGSGVSHGASKPAQDDIEDV